VNFGISWFLVPFEIDHIIARKHRGPTAAGNLAESCYYCNVYKGPNLTGRDPATGKVTKLYHPRRHENLLIIAWAVTRV
jgi:hypothetical protein